jgi:hypothetical protein
MADGYTGGHAFTSSANVVREGEARFYELAGFDPAAVQIVDLVPDDARIAAVHVSTILGTTFLNAYDMSLQQECAERIGFKPHPQLTYDQLDEKRAYGFRWLTSSINTDPKLNSVTWRIFGEAVEREIEELLKREQAGFGPAVHPDKRLLLPRLR